MNFVPEQSTATVTPRQQDLTYAAPSAQALNSAHPLEQRTKGWDEAQLNMRREVMRRAYGAAEPIRRAMEVEIVDRSSFVPSSFGGASNLHRDILLNNDATLTWEDIHKDEPTLDFAAELRSRMGL